MGTRTALSWCRHTPYILVVAAPFLFLAAFALEPLLQQGVGSFFNWYDLKPNTWAGLRQYRLVFADPVARSALLHTVVYVALTVPVEIGLGLFCAWLVTRVRWGRPLFTAVFVLPLVIPWTSASTMLLGFFNADGVLDDLRADFLGQHQPVLWFQDPKLAFAVIALAGIWKGTPWCFLLLLAALSACSADIFEAGRVDGARGLSFWLRVVVPALWPMLLFVTVFRIFAEAQTYTSVVLLTQGGPANATQLASTYDNTLAFQFFQFGEASALSTATGAVLLLVAVTGFATMYRSPGDVASRLLSLSRKAGERLGHGRRVQPAVAERPEIEGSQATHRGGRGNQSARPCAGAVASMSACCA
jgi:multiple sugar transport system permease protein